VSIDPDLLAAFSDEMQKEAISPAITLKAMKSSNPLIRKMGKTWSKVLTSKTLGRLTQDATEVAARGGAFGPGFFANTLGGRISQAALERVLPKAGLATSKSKQLAGLLTFVKRNYPGATAAAGYLPRLP